MKQTHVPPPVEHTQHTPGPSGWFITAVAVLCAIAAFGVVAGTVYVIVK